MTTYVWHVLPFNVPRWIRNYYVGQFVRYLKNIHAEYPDREISVIAHSFGGWIMEQAIRDLDFPIRTIVYVHCPISAHIEHSFYHSWLSSGKIQKVVSWSSHNDFVIGRIALPPFGQNGYYGFIRSDFPDDRERPAEKPYHDIELYNRHSSEDHSGILNNIEVYGNEIAESIWRF